MWCVQKISRRCSAHGDPPLLSVNAQWTNHRNVLQPTSCCKWKIRIRVRLLNVACWIRREGSRGCRQTTRKIAQSNWHESQDNLIQWKIKIQIIEIHTNQFINFIQIRSRSKDDPEFPRIHGSHTDTVSCKSGGKRGPEMIVRIQGEVTLRSCPYSQSKGSNSEGNYQLVEFVACSPSQVQNPTFLSTIHHRSSLPFPSGHPGSSSRWKIGPWPGVYEEEWSAVFSSAVCRLFPIERKTWRSFLLLFSDLKSRGKEGMLHVASISQRAI